MANKKVNISKFKKWLERRGAEILPLSNEYEALRFKGSEIGVLYTSGKTSGLYMDAAIKSCLYGSPWNGGHVNIGRLSNYKKQKRLLIKRDGGACFYCGEPLMGDITLEHLISLVSGGKNILSNMVLSHDKCNEKAGNKNLNDKVKLAIELRIQRERKLNFIL